jgi:hypothetical protein
MIYQNHDLKSKLNNANFRFQFFDQFDRAFFRVAAAEHLRLLGFEAANKLFRFSAPNRIFRFGVTSRISFFFAAIIPFQRSVANLRNARLNRQKRGQLICEPLIPAAFELAFETQIAVSELCAVNVNDNRRVRNSQKLGENHAGLPVTYVVRLQTGENQIGVFIANRVGNRFGDLKRRKFVSRLRRCESRDPRRAPERLSKPVFADCAPSVQTTTSPSPFASFKRSASSSA